MDDSLSQLFELASKAREQAYAPYSRFNVGCAIRAKSGKLYSGCNVENAAYPLSQCAESSAIADMILGGDSQIAEILVIADVEGFPSPCGGCRQKINEFAEENVPVHCCGPEGHRHTVTIGQLLPHSFKPEMLLGRKP